MPSLFKPLVLRFVAVSLFSLVVCFVGIEPAAAAAVVEPATSEILQQGPTNNTGGTAGAGATSLASTFRNIAAGLQMVLAPVAMVGVLVAIAGIFLPMINENANRGGLLKVAAALIGIGIAPTLVSALTRFVG